MITLTDYWMGRDVAYGLSLTPDIQRNAARTVDLINALLAVAAGAIVLAEGCYVLQLGGRHQADDTAGTGLLQGMQRLAQASGLGTGARCQQ